VGLRLRQSKLLRLARQHQSHQRRAAQFLSLRLQHGTDTLGVSLVLKTQLVLR
jgi:hypothetical protein